MQRAAQPADGFRRPSQGGIAVRRLDDAFPEGDFSVSGAVTAAGSGEPAPPVKSLLFGAGGRPSHPVAWLTVADETTEVTLRYALPWRLPLATVGDRATVTGRWQDGGEGQPPTGHFVWRDTTGALQLLVAGDFEFPNEPDLAFAAGATAGEFRSDCRTETLFDLAVSHDGTEFEVPYGARQQVGPFVILHGDLWTAVTENCSEWNPRRLLRMAAVRGELSAFEAEAGGPCGGGHCAADEVCRLPPAAACELGHADARCVPRPALAECPTDCAPVCDCAGRAHCNACAAEHRGATVAAGETSCLTCFGSGQGSAGRCAQFWECDGREARVT